MKILSEARQEVGWKRGRPGRHGLYDPTNEKDSCGVGFIAHLKGHSSRDIIDKSLVMLRSMDHRGGCGCEKNTGDGAGLLTAIPHSFLSKVARREMGINLPAPTHYGVGIVFFPQNFDQRAECKSMIESLVDAEGQDLLGWRKVPQDNSMIGETAKSTEPHMEMLFVGAAPGLDVAGLERKLSLIRKLATRRIRVKSDLATRELFYFCSLSTKVIIYKGQLTSGQVPGYFADLGDPDYKSHLAMVHSRFSTNTFPSWDRAQPFRFICHNGEINTLRGNVNWLHTRESTMQSDLFGDDLAKLLPVIEPDLSDSGAIVFTDGKYIGAVLDRNGLRPSRYYVTKDDLVIMASEVGVLPLPPEAVSCKGRLQPGRMFLVNFEEKRIIPDQVLKKETASRRPYAQWLRSQCIELHDLPPSPEPNVFYPSTLLPQLRAFGYTTETLQFMLIPLIHSQKDPIGSMGNDATLACLSDKPRMVYDYFKQLFAQVTNPAIDSIREEIIMSLECYIGPEGNLLDIQERDCHRLKISHPILTNEQLAALKHINHRGWHSRTINITFPKSEGVNGLVRTLDRICTQTSQAIADGYSLVVLSDRKVDIDRVPVSALLAIGAVHHHLVCRRERTKIGILVETGEAREVHHHCLLLGYGADAINPYLAFEALWQAQHDGLLKNRLDKDEIVTAYCKAIAKGILKVMGKMGISTLQSYKGAQIFEAVGLGEEVIQRCFVGTPSRIKGVDFEILARETLNRHRMAYPSQKTVQLSALPNDGQFHWRSDGEHHQWNPETVAKLQVAARTNSRQVYQEFARLADRETRTDSMLRGLLNLKPLPDGPLPVEEVEPAAKIMKRFCTGAMSFGSISKETHETLAIAMNRIGGRSNTGEGGEHPGRFKLLANKDSKCSAIKQVASGRFGVTSWYLSNADELQIKIAQGAKPGEGGELPGHKVDKIIAKIRHSTPGVGLISPPPHHDIYSIEDLKQLIHDLKNSNPSARISVKLVSEVGVGTIAAGVAKGFADHILISGDSGGTGASPLTSIKHAGLPWELGIAETHQTLVLNNLRSRVVLQTDGGLRTGRDVVIAALLGAEEMGFSTAPLITLGCVMMRKCHLNTCPVGIATQDPVLRKKFSGVPEHLINYLFLVAEDASHRMAKLGFRTVNDMIGRVDCLEPDQAVDHWKAEGLDLTPLLTPALKSHPEIQVYCTTRQDHGLDKALDHQLIKRAKAAIGKGEKVQIQLPVQNTNRTVGTMLSHTVSKKWGQGGLPDDTIQIKLRGSAGQSLAAFLGRGITIELEGDANDYVGKGLSGGRLIVYPPRKSTFRPEENIIIGNVALYGAISGQAFFCGMAAERFCVRNSGACTVIEGIGDHGCEYMTGGRTVILGPVGRNFAAGMSGGIAYLWDREGSFPQNCNLSMVELETMQNPADISELRTLIKLHWRYTGSTVADQILKNWHHELSRFIKVMPTEYKRALAEQRKNRTSIPLLRTG